MSYYQFNREEVLHKAKEEYSNCGGKEKTAEYCRANKRCFKRKSKQ